MILDAAAALTLAIGAPAAAQPAAPATRPQPHAGAQHGAHMAGDGQQAAPAQAAPDRAAKHDCGCCKPGEPRMACCKEHGSEGGTGH